MKDKILELLELSTSEYKNDNNGIFSDDFYSESLKSEIFKSIEVLAKVPLYDYNVEVDFDRLYSVAVREHKAKNPITIAKSTSLRKKKPEWLTDQRILQVGWNKEEVTTYRDRYFKYLESKGRSKELLTEIKRSVLNIVKNLGDPLSNEEFYKKGMVVGSVQSGKTGNFNGVINSAIDVGYKMVIVLSGLMEDLRVQTQNRIENDVVGPIRAGNRGIGVGRLYPFRDNQLTQITSRDSDFNRGLLEAGFSIHGQPNIVVCKKNVSILRNILLWLSEYVDKESPYIDIPLLIIDDEADNASLNNLGHRGISYATRTNKEIRSILALFSQKSYLGYTATPFANVLQDRNEVGEYNNVFDQRGSHYEFKMVDNLFPDDFIELLYPPSNYVGIKQFFDTRNEDVRKIDGLIAPPIDLDDPDYFTSIPPRFYIEDEAPTTLRERGTRAARKDDNYPTNLPKSLEEAVKCFVISIALRLSREAELSSSPFYQPHHTMLVHVSLFGYWQNRLSALLEDFIGRLQTSLSSDGLTADIFVEFERIWNKHYFYIVNNISTSYTDPYLVPKKFKEDILPLLPKAITDIEVKSINSITGDNLVYPTNTVKKYIAVGGNRLSRGFTLEGLTINYFLRNANTADTLMQMGRWFGYRPGYLDCCKLFTTSTNLDKFNEASLIMEDLENKFQHLARLPDRTPSDYTLWIRNNPRVIRLTRANFIRGLTTYSLSFGDTVEQATQYTLDKSKIEYSLEEFSKLASTIDWDSQTKPGFLIFDTDQEGLMKFIELPNTMLNLNILGLKEYLDACKEENKLLNWRVAVKKISRGDGDTLYKENSGLPIDIMMIKRSGPNKKSTAFNSFTQQDIFKARNATIISPKDFSITLTDEAIAEVEMGEKAPSDRDFRSKMDESTGILLIYMIDLQKVFQAPNDEDATRELKQYSEQNGLDSLTNIPLIGYALGFPDVKNVTTGEYVAQHVFKELNEMSLEELKEYADEQDFGIKLENKTWTKEKLLEEIVKYEGDDYPND